MTFDTGGATWCRAGERWRRQRPACRAEVPLRSRSKPDIRSVCEDCRGSTTCRRACSASRREMMRTRGGARRRGGQSMAAFQRWGRRRKSAPSTAASSRKRHASHTASTGGSRSPEFPRSTASGLRCLDDEGMRDRLGAPQDAEHEPADGEGAAAGTLRQDGESDEHGRDADQCPIDPVLLRSVPGLPVTSGHYRSRSPGVGIEFGQNSCKALILLQGGAERLCTPR